MTPEELVERFRLNVDDTDADDPLWTDIEAYSYLDSAQKAFARTTDYFSDASTAEIVEVPVTAGSPWVDLDPRITKLRHAVLDSRGSDVTPMTYEKMKEKTNTSDAYGNPYGFSNSLGWTKSTGTPRFIVTDMEQNKGRLAPIPTADDTLNLQVYRLPLNDITEDSQALEISESEYQIDLLPYMEYMAYNKNDVDTLEQALAAKAQGMWRIRWAEIKQELRRKRYYSTSGTVRYGGL